LVGDVARLKPGLWTLVTQPEELDDEERYVDVDEDEEQSGEGKDGKERKTGKGEEEKKYDGKKRDPLYCHAEMSCLWELVSTFTL
jgi:ribosome biogenesis protein MAK21